MKFGRHHLLLCLFIVVTLDRADVSDPAIYENCTDYRNQVVPHGERFRPMNTDACHSCSCEYGRPEMCQSRLCSAPKTCTNALPVDDTCCVFECPDDVVGGRSGKAPPSNGTILEPTDDILSTTNLGLRLVASTVTSFLILALLLFMIHRLRQRRLLLMLRRLDMNGSHLSSAPFGVRRYSFDDDGSVGYLTGQDQVDFAPYDEPPPPYTFWKPPESYFPQEEAPPPYEASNNNNSINNAMNSTIHQNGGMAVPLAQVAPLIPNPYTAHCITPSTFVPPSCLFANATLPNGNLPSLTQVPLRTNNFHMNNLDEVREPNAQRHSVPIQDLNVVGSQSSLNSSQSELNDSHVEPVSSLTLVIRSDAVYEEYSAGMLPPLSPAASTGGSTGVLGTLTRCGEPNLADQAMAPLAAATGAAISTGTYSVKRSKYGRGGGGESMIPFAAHGGTTVIHGSPLKCHSCSDVAGCRHQKKPMHNICKRRSLQPGINCCPDPTAWSETSSSSSPTYERTTGTLSPTSSDSSSIDYNFGQGCAIGTSKHDLPRRTHSDTHFGGGRKASAPSLEGGSSGGGSSSVAAMSSSLDRTLFNLRNKISLKKKKKQQQPSKGHPSKLRILLGGLHGSSSANDNMTKDQKLEKQDLCPAPPALQSTSSPNDCQKPILGSNCVAKVASVEKSADGIPGAETNFRHCAVGQRPGWRTPRILYVSDGDISLRSLISPQDNCSGDNKAAEKPSAKATEAESPQARPRNLDLEKRCRPHSYDFGDLQSVECCGEADSTTTATTYPIKEEGTPASGEDATRSDNPPSLPTNTVDCCCSLSSDRLGSSWDSFTCTCSSRASFDSGSGSSSSGSCEVNCIPDSPAQCATVAENSPEQAVIGVAELPRTRANVAHLNRSGSVCSETGEKKHRMLRQQPPMEEAAMGIGARMAAEAQMLSPVSELSSQSDCRPAAVVSPEPSHSAAGPPPPTLAVANRIRVTIGTWKGTHESYI